MPPRGGRTGAGLLRCVGSQDTLFALDWQHTSSRFAPQKAGGPGQPAWPLSLYPDGVLHGGPGGVGHQGRPPHAAWDTALTLEG
ncbi:DUF2716 domain-containing protein [Streptomyces sp. NPDC051453]|uniref:DUF2716 domain-containing protein n=1 Tax=Streptomyces sp. NPDC051453 TaxID=3154941 RepID=UPI0034148580